MKRAKSGHLCFQHDTHTPRHRAPPRRRSLLLGKPEPRVSALSGPPRHSSASLRRTSLPRRSIALPRRTCKSCFGSFLPLILTIIH